LSDILAVSTDSNELFNLIYNARNRVDLFFDAMKPINSEHNTNIIIFLKGLKSILENGEKYDTKKIEEIQKLYDEMHRSVSTGILKLKDSMKNMG